MSKVQIDTEAPDFVLNDFDGKKISLSDYRNKKNVLLVLNRGFLWPFCRRHIAQLRQKSDKLTNLDIEVLVAGPENSDSFRRYWKKESLPFKGLPDPNHSVMKLYGQEVKLFKLGRMPAQMLIDKSGILKFVYYGNSMSDIPDISELEKTLSSEWIQQQFRAVIMKKRKGFKDEC